MIDFDALNKTLIQAFKETEWITITDSKNSFECTVEGVFTEQQINISGDPLKNNIAIQHGFFELEVLTADIKDYDIKRLDRVFINDIPYKIDETPHDSQGITTLVLRK